MFFEILILYVFIKNSKIPHPFFKINKYRIIIYASNVDFGVESGYLEHKDRIN